MTNTHQTIKYFNPDSNINQTGFKQQNNKEVTKTNQSGKNHDAPDPINGPGYKLAVNKT